MTDFNFNGDWEIVIRLDDFAKIYETTDKSQAWNNHRIELMKGNIPIRIKDNKSYDPDPLREQINSINHLCTNQNDVLTGLLNALKKINANYVERCGEDDWIPQPLNLNSIGELLSVEEIIILTEHKNNQAYIQLDCSYKGDGEHGLSIVMHDQTLIDYGAMFELNYGKLYKDLGPAAQRFRSANIEKQKFGLFMIHKKLSKYGKFKPWQLEATSDHFETLLRTKQNHRLKEIITNKEWDYNMRFGYRDWNLLDLAADYNNDEILNLLIKLGGDNSRVMVK